MRTERDSDRKKRCRLDGTAETSKEHAEWRRLQQRNLSILGLLKSKEWPQYHTESSWQVRQSRQSRAPDREWRESQGEQEPHLDEKERHQSESMEGESGRHCERKGVSAESCFTPSLAKPEMRKEVGRRRTSS